MIFINEPVAVEARIGMDGAARPVAFVWQGRRYDVAEWGRTWGEGDVRCFLVMTPAQEIFELHLMPDGRWKLARASQRPHIA